MKIGKHDHKLTDLLKVLIFSIVMLAPLLAVSSTILLYTFNKVVEPTTQEVIETPIYNTNEVNEASDLVEGNIYHFQMDFTTYTNSTILMEGYSFYNIQGYNTEFDVIMGNEQGYKITKSNNTSLSITYANTNYAMGAINSVETHILECDLVYKGLNYQDSYTNYSICTNVPKTYEVIEHEATINNLFYEATEELNNNDLFNWTQNTAIYSGLNAMNTAFGITNPTITLLLTYWSLITAIYIIFDIIITMFTKLTHLVSLQKE